MSSLASRRKRSRDGPPLELLADRHESLTEALNVRALANLERELASLKGHRRGNHADQRGDHSGPSSHRCIRRAPLHPARAMRRPSRRWSDSGVRPVTQAERDLNLTFVVDEY